MPKQPKNIYLIISFALSLISIAATIGINIVIEQEYLRVDGKTRALFGIKELLQFGYQYYVSILGLIAFVFAILAAKHNSGERRFFMAIVLSLVAIMIVFIRVWRLFV